MVVTMLLSICANAQTFNATWYFSNFVQQPQSVSICVLTPMQPDYNYGGVILPPIPMYQVTGTNGQATYSNLVAGYSYQIDLNAGGTHYIFTNNFPVGLSNTVNAAQYTGFWVAGTQPQIFAYFTATNWLTTTSSNITFYTNFFNFTNNLTGTNFGLSAGTNTVVTTNGNSFSVNVPDARFSAETNLLGSAAYSASTAFMPNPMPVTVTNWALASVQTNTLTATNQFVSGTNSVAVNAYTQLTASNAVLVASVNALNATLTAMVNSVSNQLQNTKLTGNGILTNLAATGAFTNGLAAGTTGTNVYIFTNAINQVIITVPDARFQSATNLMGSAAYASASSFMPNPLPASVTNQFITTAGTNGLVTAAQLAAGTNAAVGAAYAIGAANTNLSLAIGQGGTNYANQVGLAATNAINATSNSLTVSIGLAAMNYANLIGAQQTNNRFSTSNSILLTASQQASNAIFIASGSNSNYVNQLANRAVTNLDTRDTFLFSYNNQLNGNFRGNGGSLSNLNANNLTNGYLFLNTNLSNISSNGLQVITNIASGYVATNGGKAFSLSIPDLMILGGHTNLFLDTNYFIVFGAGSPFVNGIYHQTTPVGTWTNVGSGKGLGTIFFSSGSYSILSNSISLYTIAAASIPGYAAFTFGLIPNPFVCFGSDSRDSILVGVATYAPDLMLQASSNAYSASGNYPVGGFVAGVLSNETFSVAGSNYIASEILANAQNPTNGVSSTTASNIANVQISIATNFIPLGGVLAQSNTLAIFSTTGTNSITNLVMSSYGVLSTITNIASSSGGSGGANTNLNNISSTATNVIQSIASGAATGIAQLNGHGTNTIIVNAQSIGATNIINLGLEDYQSNTQTNAGLIYLLDGFSISGIDSGGSGASGSIYGGRDVAGQPLLEFDAVRWGGIGNDIRTWNHNGSIVGGLNNIIGNNGGSDNHQGDYAAIDGGGYNHIGDNAAVNNQGDYGFIGGGFSNTVWGNYSVAMGANAKATNSNTFVWNDTDQPTWSYTNQSFVIGTSQGVAIATNKPNIYGISNNKLEVNGNVDSTVGFTVAGVPVGGSSSQSGLFIQQQYGVGTNVTIFGTNYIGGTYFYQGSYPTGYSLWVTGNISVAQPAYGQYNPVTNNPAVSYTNISGTGYVFTPVKAPNATGFFIISNSPTGTYVPGGPYYSLPAFYSYNGLVGVYPVISDSALSTGNVTVAFGQLTNYQAGVTPSVSIGTNSAGTNALQVFGAISALAYSGLQNVAWQYPDTNAAPRSASLTWVYPLPPYNSTNYPYSIITTN